MRIACYILLLFHCSLAMADMTMDDDPLLGTFMLDEFEYRNGDEENSTHGDMDAWVGKDLHKVWFKSAFERNDGVTENTELQLLYSRAISPYWDIQGGLRSDIGPEPNRYWLAFGFQGLAPYFFEVDAAGFIGEHGRLGLRIESEYELLITQRLILTPDVEITLFSKDDVETGAGSGLANIEAGLRLRYEIKREIAPYIGVNWYREFGRTRDFRKATGDSTSDVQLILGLRIWM